MGSVFNGLVSLIDTFELIIYNVTKEKKTLNQFSTRVKNSSLQQYLIEFREAHRKGREKKS